MTHRDPKIRKVPLRKPRVEKVTDFRGTWGHGERAGDDRRAPGLSILDLHRLHRDFAERARRSQGRRKRRPPRSGSEGPGELAAEPRQGDLLEQVHDQHPDNNSSHLRDSPDTPDDHSCEEGAR